MKNEVTVIDATRPVLGYIAVVYFCLLAGNLFRTEAFILSYSILKLPPEQFLFLLFLIPFYINRIIIYEQKDSLIYGRKDNEGDVQAFKDYKAKQIKLSYQLPLLLLVFILFVYFYLTVAVYKLKYKEIFISSLYYITALFPFYIQSIRADRILHREKFNELDLLGFRFYIFFPALCTCMIPFVFGWCNFSNGFILISTTLLISTYWFFSNFKTFILYNDPIYIGVAGLIILCSFNPIIYEYAAPFYTFSVVFAMALLMSVAMGLPETWWFIKDNKNFKEYPSGEQDLYTEYTNRATAIIPLLLPCTILYHNANLSYSFISIGVYSILLYTIWFIYKGSQWKLIRFVLGIIAPMLIGFSFHSYISLTDLIIDSYLFIGIFVGIVMGLSSLLFTFLFKEVVPFATRFYIWILMKTLISCFVVIALLGLGTMFFLFKTDPSFYSVFFNKIYFLLFYYAVIILTIFIFTMFKAKQKKDETT